MAAWTGRREAGRGREKAEKRAATIERQKTRAALEIGHETARLNAVLQAQISEVRREVARMGLRAEDE